MTRYGIATRLNRIYRALGFVLLVALAAKLARHVPGVAGTRAGEIAPDVYAYIKEMAPVFITVVAAYLASVFQKRSKFTASLEEEWRNIVRTKSALVAYFEKPYPSTDDYLAAYARLSETIDTMRIVYRNAGETKGLVGLYPYAPLHDMRRTLQAMDPRIKNTPSPAERKLGQDSILQSFAALRENFLEELDLDEPDHPLLISGGRRLKVPGSTDAARRLQARQREAQSRSASPSPEVDAFLGRLYAAEHQADAGNAPVEPAPTARRQ